MVFRSRAAALACVVVVSFAPCAIGTTGFVAARASLFSHRTATRGAARMALNEGADGVLEEATSSAVGKRRATKTPEAPPDLDTLQLQTENQRRRALPLSRLKRVKPKKRIIADEEGEFRPLVAKTDRESVLRGEDYWIDYREVDAKAAKKEARAKAPAADQFAQSKIRAEISNPYKQNWILVISMAIVAVAGFIRINPGILDNPTLITFPTEL